MNSGGCPVRLRQALFFLCLLAALYCLLPCRPAEAQHYTFSHFSQTDGLLNQDVSAIVQDDRGVLWVGTENGLYQADGSHFVRVDTYRVAAYGSVQAMHVDSKGRVWVLGAKHLVYFTGDGTLHIIAGLDLSLLLDAAPAVSSLAGQPDTLYILCGNHLQQVRSTDGGISWQTRSVFSPKALQAEPYLDKLSGLIADGPRQELWAGCGTALCELHPPAPEAVDRTMQATRWGTDRSIPENTWGNLLLTRDGALWARGTGDVLKLDPNSWAVSRYGQPSAVGDPPARYGQLLEDLDGSILATIPDGIARLKQGVWKDLTSKNGLPTSQIVTMFFDRAGGFWLAPVGQGIWRWRGYGSWQAWTRSEGLSSDVVWNILRDNSGRLWSADSVDVDQIDEAGGKTFARVPAAPLQEAQSITTDARGHIWVGSSAGTLVDFNPDSLQQRKVATDLDFVYMVKRDTGTPGQADPQRVWICSSKGVSYVSAADNWSRVHPVQAVGAPLENVWGLTQSPSGTLWFAAKGGIYRLFGGSWTRIQFPSGARLVDYPVLQAAPDGTLWLQAALPEPLLHIEVVGNEARMLEAVPESMIGTDDLSFIRVDHRNWLWVGSDLGVYVFDGTRWVHCTEEDGLISDDTDTSGVFEDKDGSMWFSTAAGLSHLLKPEELFRVPAPEISIRDVRLNGTPLQSGVHANFNLRAPELSVQLFSTYYKRPRALAFRYRLLGLEDEWQTTDTGTLLFSSLPPGDYTLSVQAVDKRVQQFSTPIDYSFTVLPPWYKRDWFRVLAAFFLFFVGAVGWRVSLHRLRASEANLKVKVDRQTAQLLSEKAQLERTQQELVETSRRDALTGLLNRSAIFDVLAQMRRTALERGTTLSVVMADLDHFKQINDQYGHTVGDAVLRECAERFRDTLRPGDAVGRYGGEELILVIPGLSPTHTAARMEEIREAICSTPIIHGRHALTVTCSFGVAWLNERHRNLEAVVDAADEALYIAKQNGRNRVEFTPATAEDQIEEGRSGVKRSAAAEVETE